MSYDEQRKKTLRYAKEHHINELFSHLVQSLTYTRPENPRQFLRDEIRKMRVSAIQSLFTEDDITTMFEMIDVTKQSTISIAQLRNTCRNLAADAADSNVDESAIQAAADSDGRVGLIPFRKVVSAQLATKNYWINK
eukprot:Tbor_TRINITY_DN3864_c0_g1::TRINITY_DN3864_c0_g1_i2::g.5653::m.5653